MPTFDIPPYACPDCGAVQDQSTAVTGQRQPAVGDFFVCLECGALMEFGPGLVLRRVGKATLDGLTAKERAELQGIRERLAEFRQARPLPPRRGGN